MQGVVIDVPVAANPVALFEAVHGETLLRQRLQGRQTGRTRPNYAITCLIRHLDISICPTVGAKCAKPVNVNVMAVSKYQNPA
jgi:hypothetical protein